jgi:hypothetical protein
VGFRGGCGGRTIEGRDKPRRLGMGRGRQGPSPSLPPNPSGASLQAHTSDTQAGAGDTHTGGGGGRGGGEKQSRPNIIPGRQSLAQSNALRAYVSPSANPCSKRRCQTRRAGAPGLYAPELQGGAGLQISGVAGSTGGCEGAAATQGLPGWWKKPLLSG